MAKKGRHGLGKRLSKSACYALGVAGAAMGLAAGTLMAMGLGAAAWLRAASFALIGAMLLFLASSYAGADNKRLRTRLLLLFFLLLVSFFNLPLLCPPLEAIVLPLLLRWVGDESDRPWWWLLVGTEALYAIARTVALAGSLLPYVLLINGTCLALVSLVRGGLIIRVRRRTD